MAVQTASTPVSQRRDELAEIEAALDALPPMAADPHDENVPAWGLMLASP